MNQVVILVGQQGRHKPIPACAHGAARRIYVEYGFSSLTMRRVAAELDWTPTALYRYYGDRDALLAALRTELFREFAHALRAAGDAAESAEAPLAITRATFAFASEHIEGYKLMFAIRQPPPSNYPELRQARKDAFNVVVNNMARAVDAGLLVSDARDIGHRTWLACQGMITLYAANQLTEGRDFDNLKPQVERMLFPELVTAD